MTTDENLKLWEIEGASDAIPNDAQITSQWHLRNSGQSGGIAGVDLNVFSVWPDYTGAGVRIALIDDGFDLTHPELAGRFSTALSHDYAGNDSDIQAATGNNHGTPVTGIIGAAANNAGTLGIAYDATLAGLRIAFGANGNIALFDQAMAQMKNFDVVNNSWGYVGAYADNFSDQVMALQSAAITQAVNEGRNGLGTNIVFAAGNSGANGDNVNYHDVQNSPYVISVGALNNRGFASSFSTPGAALLISAPGQDIVTTDLASINGYNITDYVTVGGTSFAAPMITGVVALMLEANPGLGYRDVQEILAYSARKVGDTASYQTNGATNLNGGGLHFSHGYGFGLVDAHAAVRLAETWSKTNTEAHTYTNMVQTHGANLTGAEIPDNLSDRHLTSTITIPAADNVVIDRVEVLLNITHNNLSQLDIILTSPSGTRAILADNAPLAEEMPTWTFNSVASWGENAAGTWTLEVYDRVTNIIGSLDDWSLTFLGDNLTNNDVYVFTDEYAGNATLRDSNGGKDIFNAAAVSTSVLLDLTAGSANIGSHTVTIQTAAISTVFTGDAPDAVRGDFRDNTIHTGRGDDIINASAGYDTIDGGTGTDLYIADTAFAHNVLVNAPGDITLTSRVTGDIARVSNVENFMFGGSVYTLSEVIDASQTLNLTSVTYAVHGAAGVAIRTSDRVSTHSHTAAELNIGGQGDVLLAEREAGHLTLTNNAGADLNAVSMHMDDGLDLTLRGFSQVSLVADGTRATSIDIGGGQRGFIQTGSGDDHVDFLAFLIDNDAPAQERTLTAHTGDGADTVTITDRSSYLVYDIDLGSGNDLFLASGTQGGHVFGGEGADTFAFGLNNNGSATYIDDFSVLQGDKIDLSRLLTFDDPLEGAIARFIDVTTRGNDTVISVDQRDIVTLSGVQLTDPVQHYLDTGLLVIDQA